MRRKKLFAAMLAAAVAFAACGSLQYIMFPKTVTTVGTKLVTDLTSLLAVRYIGTEDEWNASEDAGIQRVTCVKCGLKKEESIPKKEHNFSEWCVIIQPTTEREQR